LDSSPSNRRLAVLLDFAHLLTPQVLSAAVNTAHFVLDLQWTNWDCEFAVLLEDPLF
jgi:hypothetical protein